MLTSRVLGLPFNFIFIWLAMAANVRAVNPAMPAIPTNVFVVTGYGAVGDGAKDNTTNIQSAIDAAKAAGGGIVEIPAGTYLSGPLTLFSRMNLRVDAGGTLRMLPLNAYPKGGTNGITFISTTQADDVELSGWGTID